MPGWVQSLASSADGSMLAIVGRPFNVALCKRAVNGTYTLVQYLSFSGNNAKAISFSADG